MKNKGITKKEFSMIVKSLVIFAVVYFLYGVAFAKTIRVAVIDTGLNQSLLLNKVKLCDSGHSDFTGENNPFKDPVGHGTNVSGTIEAYSNGADYCQIILKFYTPESGSDIEAALKKAIELKVDVINISGGGEEELIEESKLVKKALSLGIKMVLAAGNKRHDLNKHPYFPACLDKRAVMVVALNERDDVADYSNRFEGRKKQKDSKCVNDNVAYEYGASWVKLIDGKYLTLRGTSQATAIHTGKLIKNYNNKNTIKRRVI